MTKVIILGEAKGAEPEKKKIEFVKFIGKGGQSVANLDPHDYKNVELICKGYDYNISEVYDIMFAYDDDRDTGCLYLGKFNDGIV